MKEKKFDLRKMAFVAGRENQIPGKKRANAGNKAGAPKLEITDVATLHQYVCDAIENGLTLDPIWHALNRECLEYDDENTHIVELLGIPKNQKCFYVVKVDAENRYCDLLRKVSVLEYTMMNLQVISILESEQAEATDEKGISQPVKVAIVYAILESIMKILERGESVVTQGLFVSGDYLYPSDRQPSARQIELARELSLYEKMLYFAKQINSRHLEINLNVLEDVDIDLSLPK